MKIIQVIGSMGTGGAEKLLLDTIPLYCESGLVMDLAILWDNNSPFARKLKTLQCNNIYVLNYSEKEKDIYSVRNIFKLAKIIKGYDIVHVHLFPALYFVAAALFFIRGRKPKLVFTEHSTTNKRMTHPLLSKIDKYIYSKYDKIICITDEIKRKLQQVYGIQEDRLKVIQNGVDIKKIEEAVPEDLSKLLGLKNGDMSVALMQVAAFRKGKDQQTVIRALQHLPADYHLLLIGEGDYKLACEALAEELNLKSRVHFLGQRMDVPALIKGADILILSTEFEGLSLASIEAMASGKPFVASDVPGITDLVKDYGVLFPLGDDRFLAHELQALITNREYREQVISRCRQRAEAFNINRMIDNHIELYKKLSNNK